MKHEIYFFLKKSRNTSQMNIHPIELAEYDLFLLSYCTHDLRFLELINYTTSAIMNTSSYHIDKEGIRILNLY